MPPSACESASVTVFALVESKRLFVQIPEQMKRLNVHISSMQRTFEKRPEVFQAVRVDVTLRVANSVVDNSAVVVSLKIIIRHERVGADGRTLLNVCARVPAKLRPTRIIDNLQDHLGKFIRRCALQDALHGGFLESGMSDAGAFISVHVGAP